MTDRERYLLLEISYAVAGLLHQQEVVVWRHPGGTMRLTGLDASNRILKASEAVIVEKR